MAFSSSVTVPDDWLEKWQAVVDMVAVVMDVPAALIMRVDKSDIEVFRSSASEGNPYRVGAREPVWDSGLYCEHVIKTHAPLVVPDARRDPAWATNPDIKLSMVSYMGYPISHPDGHPFGTFCVLDSKENHYSPAYASLLAHLRDLIESQLATIAMNAELGDENVKLNEYLQALQHIQGVVRICSKCKAIEDQDGLWQPVERWLIKHPRATFSHGYCPHCFEHEMARATR